MVLRQNLVAFFTETDPQQLVKVDQYMSLGDADALRRQLDNKYNNSYSLMFPLRQDTYQTDTLTGGDASSSGSGADEVSRWLWKDIVPHGDKYTLRWESDILIQLGRTIRTVCMDQVTEFAAKEAIKQTVLNALLLAVAWPIAVVKATNMIDSAWTIACDRADKAGKVRLCDSCVVVVFLIMMLQLLAEVLLQHHQGRRPVTLIGGESVHTMTVGAGLPDGIVAIVHGRHAVVIHMQ